MGGLLDRSEAIAAGCVRMTVQAKATKAHPEITDDDISSLRQKIIQRIQGLGIATGATQSMKNRQILIQASQAEDIATIARSISTTGELQLRIQKPNTAKQLAAEMAALRTLEAKRYTIEGAKDPQSIDLAISKQNVKIGKLFQPYFINGERIQNAMAQAEKDGSWSIQVQFDSIGNKEFAKQTKNIAGTGRSVGIFIDGNPVSMPIIDSQYARNGIVGGYAVISGNFDRQTASVLAVKLKTGVLPIPVEIMSQGLYKSCPILKQ
jgi:preprotein translocase subunit SecD